MLWGLTAKMAMSASDTAAALSGFVRTWKVRRKWVSLPVTMSETQMEPGLTISESKKPRISASAMFPPPMKASLGSLRRPRPDFRLSDCFATESRPFNRSISGAENGRAHTDDGRAFLNRYLEIGRHAHR